MKKSLLNIYYLNILVLGTQKCNKSSPLMELRIYLGKNRSKSMTTVQWVKGMIEDLPGGGQKN